MTPNSIAAIALAIQAGEPIVAWGLPGTGKTRTMEAIAKSLGLQLETVIAAIREPSDFSGLPVQVDGSVKLVPPVWAKNLEVAGKGILFLDEISTAPPTVQAALLRVVLDRVVGECQLPTGVSIVAAANPPESAAGGWDLAPPLANRLIHLEWKPDVESWCQGMISGFKTPELPRLSANWRLRIRHHATMVASFVKARPDLLLQLPQAVSNASKAWPSPRTWDMAARMWAACEDAKVSKEVLQDILAGCVGPGPSLELLTWVEELNLPDPEHMLEHPDTIELPVRDDQVYAVLAAVSSIVVHNNTVDRWKKAWKVMGRAAKERSIDVGAHAARVLANNKPSDIKPNDLPAEIGLYAKVLLQSSPT